MPSGKWLVTCLAGILVIAVAVTNASPTPRVVEKQRYAMGTMFSVVVSAVDPTRASVAIDAALAEVVRLDGVLSHYDPHSELSRLARHGTARPVRASADLHRTLERAVEMSRLSNGRFDVTVGALVRLWRDARALGREPPPEARAATAACVGTELFTLAPPDLVHLHSPCLSLDLGGIGKGVAVDGAIDVLRTHGITDAVVNSGGSTIRAIGSAAGRTGWPVQMATGDEVIDLQNMALSTSQSSGEVIVGGRREPTTNPLTVTVITPTATAADALSTALLLSTLDEGHAMLGQVPDVRAWWTRPDGRVVSTYGVETTATATTGVSW